MKTSVVVGTLLLIFIKIRITQGQQRIREGRCPPIRKRTDCPAFVWDECTCDSDCSGKKKCCLDGCKYACLDPDEVTPSVRNKADVVFIMDSSGSIGADDYNREKQFVKDLTNVFQVSPTEARISTIIYSDDPKLIFDFDAFNDSQSINIAIDGLEFLGNRTRIDKALAMALRVFSKSRPAVPRIAFVLTDGKQTDDYDAKPLDVAVRPLQDLGVHVYVIGIGIYVDPRELRLLARRQEDVFTVDSFELLLQQTHRIVNRIDTHDAIPPLNITADIMFLVDSSSAIPGATYGDQLKFLQTIVNQFRISPRYVRASVIPYGSTAQLSIPFGRHTTNAAINQSIASLPYVGGQKRIDGALWLANQTFLQARPLVPKILLILTRGGQLADVGTNVRLPVKALRDQGVSIFTVAIGDGVDYSTLRYIVENDNLIIDKSYKSLEPYLPPAASYIRVKSDFSTPLSKDAAVVFLMDSSEEVESHDFKRQREFVISLAKAFQVSEKGVLASVVTYGKFSRPTVQFKDSTDVNNFINAMIRSSQIKGQRMMDKALSMAARMFEDHNEVAPRVVILFTSGPHSGKLDQLKTASKRVRDLGARIYVVAIGSSVDNSQIEGLVNSSVDIIKLPSFMDLQSEIHFVGRHVSLLQVSGPDFIADVVFLVDASSSVGVVNFRRQGDFVQAVAQALNFGERATRASLVVYSGITRRVTDFDSPKTLGGFKNAVDRAQYLRGGRRVDKALEDAAELLSSARPGIPKVTVLITSGRRDSGTPLREVSRQLERYGVRSFVVAIGTLPDLGDYSVLSKERDIFRIQSFVDLPRIQKSFPQHIISSFDVKRPTPITTSVRADVIFIMDSSSSVSSQNYRKEKDFVKYLATYLNVAPDKSRAALITYGNSASEVVQFDIKRPRADFESAVEKAPSVGRNRRIDKALDKASQMMAKARPKVRKIVVLLTSGKQVQESGSKTPGEAAIPLLEGGVYNYVVAIGREPDISELQPVVQQPAQIFRMTSFDDLGPRQTKVGQIIVETSIEPVTDIISEIVFILDSSNDVTRDEYIDEKSFVKELARYLNVAPGKSRAAVITYGQRSNVLFKYDGYDSLTFFDAVINKASYVGGTKRIDLALDDAGHLLREAKRCIPRWVILLTAGRHPNDPGVKSLLDASKPVQDLSDKVYVVAIGNKPDLKELRDIVEDPKDIFAASSFQSLKPQAKTIATAVVDRNDADLCVMKTFQAAIVFLVDTTSLIGTLDFRSQKKFVKSVAKSLNVCQDSSQAAIVTYGSLSSQPRPTDIYKDLSLFEQAVDNSQYLGGRGRLHLAIDVAEQLLKTVAPSLKRIVVILTGGQPLIQDAPSLKQSFKKLRIAGNERFVVAISTNYDKEEFLPAVDWPEDIFSVSSFDNLVSQACSISKAIAERTDSSIPRDFTADVLFIMDSSTDVSRADYEKEKDFIESLADHLRLSPGRTRAAVLTYGYTTTLVAKYDSYETLQTFSGAVDRASYIGGSGRIDYALAYASRELKDTRQLVPKIVLLLTAGRLSSDQSLRLAAQPLHDRGFKVYLVTIGDKPDVIQLLPIVKNDTFVISVPSFDDLSQRALSVAQTISKHSDPELPADFPGADVLFMVDSSSNISRNNFEKQKDLVKYLIKTMDSFSSKSRISFITYGNRARVLYGLENNMNSESQLREIDSVQPMSGGRRMDRALEEAVRIMQNSKPTVPKIILLFAAGKQIEETGVRPLDSYGRTLQKYGVDAFVLGIGKDVVPRDLEQVVQDAKNVFRVEMFHSLTSIDRQLAYQIVKRTIDGMIETDVVFVMDSSFEVTQSDYQYEKEAIKSMARSLKVPSSQSRASVITYGNIPLRVVNFDGYKSFSSFENLVDRARRIGGRRRIDLALEDAGKLLSEARPSVRRNVILLTSGRTHPSSRDLYVSAKRIFENAADLLVIAVGRRPNFKELTAIVKKPTYVYNVSSFSDLHRISNEIRRIVIDERIIYNDFVADIVFLMDSSWTVDQKVYDRQKNFIKSMVRSLNLSTGKSRVAVVSYGYNSVEVVRFSSPQDKASTAKRVGNARRVNGRRDIARALQFSASLLENSRPDVFKVIIFLTSGSELYLTLPSQALRDYGAHRYVIAIGSNVDEEELTPIIDEPRDMFTIRTPPQLTWKTDYIADEIIKRTVTKRTVLPLDFDADVLFLVDSSMDVGQGNYNKEKNFVKSLSYILNLRPGQTRVAVVIYGNSIARSVIGFTDHASHSSFFTRVDALPFLRGRRRLDRALIEGGYLLNTARQLADKVVILLTSGRQTQEEGALPLNQAMESIRSHKANVFVVAIGQRVDQAELRLLTSEPIVVPGFNVLIRNSIGIAKDIKNITDQRDESPGADIVFLVDSSSGVTKDNDRKGKEFVTSLAKQLNFGSDKTRVGVILYSEYARLAARFNVVKNAENLQRLLDGTARLQGSRRIDRALKRAAQLFGESRPNVRKILVLLTSGRNTSNSENPFQDAVQRLETKGVDRFVVAIAPYPDPELYVVVERNKDLFSVPSFDSLQQPKVIQIARHILKEVTVTTTTTTTVTTTKRITTPSTVTATPTTTPMITVTPGFKADVIFLIDSASGVTTNNFTTEKEFVKDLSAVLNLSPLGSRVAIILYASSPSLKIELGAQKTLESLSRRLDGLTRLEGMRRMDRALELASVNFDNNRPKAVRKIVVLLTSGKQTGGGKPLSEAVESLQKINAERYVVAIGPQVSEFELRPVVSGRSDIMPVPSFDLLTSKVKPVAEQIINGSRSLISSEFKSDILFIMDSSSPVNRDDFQTQKEVVKSIMKSFHVTRGRSRAAVIAYGNYSEKLLRFNSSLSANHMESVVDTATSIGGSPRIDEVLVDAADVFRDANQSIPRIVIMFTTVRDLTDSHKKAVDKASEVIHDMGARVYIIAVGKGVDVGSLKKVADSLVDVFKVPTFKDVNDSMAEMIYQRVELPKPVVPMDFTGDVIFLVDSSSEVSREQFKKEKYFVASLAKTLNLSPAKTRGSAITYGRYALVGIEFDDHPNPATFEQAVDNLPQIWYERRMDKALRTSVDIIKFARADVPKVVLLLTAGRQSPPRNTLLPSVKPLKDLGISVFVVGIGSRPDSQELRSIVEEPGDVLRVSTFNDFSPSRTRQIARHIVKRTELPIHDIKAEVIFLLDASKQIGRENFEKQKAFIKLLARSLNVFPGNSTAAVIAYSSGATTNIALGNYETVEEFERNVDSIPFYGDSRKMYRGLEEAAYLFQNATSSDVDRKVILITGGRQTLDEDEEPLDNFKRLLLDVGALPFIVAVGNDHDNQTLRAAVADPSDIFRIPTFFDLLSSVSSTAARIANRKAPPMKKDEYFIFLLDSSSTVRQEQFQRQKDFIKSLAEYLQIGSSDKTKAAVINYGSVPSARIKFNDYRNLQGFKSGIDRITPLRGSRRIDRALSEAAVVLRDTDQSSRKILVLLTAGQQAKGSDVTPLEVAIQPLRDVRSHMYVVALGNEPSTRELRPLVTELKDMFRVPYNFMESMVPNIVGHIREENPYPGPTHDVVLLVDSSDVSRFDFYQEILFVKSLARELSVTPAEFQVAVVTYGNRYSSAVRFGSYDSLREFHTAVDASVYLGGARRMDRAFKAASTILSSRNPASKKAVVLLTGGRNSREADLNSLLRSVQPLFKMEATIIVMAFGDRYDVQELLPTVKKSQDIRSVPQAHDLVRYASEISRRIIDGPVEPKTPILDTDVIFVMDSSYEVNQEEYKSEKDFIKSLIRSLNVSTDTSRAALISYGDLGSLSSRFIGLKSLTDFDKLVDNASYVGGERRIDRALEIVTQTLNEARAGSSKVVIFLTGGRQASRGRRLDEVAGLLRENGAKTYVIAIGTKSDAQELRPLVASPEDLVTLLSFKELNSQISKIASHISEKAVCLRPDYILDVVFLMDTSTGVDSRRLKEEKTFVKLLAKCFNVSPGKSRASVITFGTTTSREIDFNSYESTGAFEALVDGISSIGGERRIDKALEAAGEVLRNSLPSVPKLVVLLTSGRQPTNALSFSEASKPLHSMGAMFYVVSIANNLDKKYFEALVDHPSQVSQASSFGSLIYVLPQVTQGVEQGITNRMQLNADVVFLMDASTAENARYFRSQKDLIKSIVRSIGSSSDKLRASLITYSSSVNVLANLNSYSNLQRFEADVDKALYITGPRRMDLALTAAARQLSQSRPNAAKIVILITTGRQAQVVGMTPLNEASKPLRDANADIFVIGIGKQPDLRELMLVTKHPVKIIPTPDNVIVNVHLWLRKLRQQVNKENGSPLIPKADLIFLVDSSTDVNGEVFKEQKDFVKSIVGKFLIAPNQTRVAVARYSSSASSVITFTTFDNLLDLVRGIDSIRYVRGIRRMDAALKEANKLRETARSGVPTYVIFLTAGRQASTAVSTPLDRAAQPILDSTARMFVVGIGPRPEEMELRSMVERSRDVFRFPSEKLDEEVPLFVIYMASQIGAPMMREFKADILFLVDSSQTISKREFLRELEFVKAFARKFDISPDKSRVGVITFGSAPILSIRFEEYGSILSFSEGVNVVPYQGGQKRLDKALIYAARVLSKARPKANKLLVLLTDGQQPLDYDPNEVSVDVLRRLGVHINIIGAGRNVSMQQLRKLTLSSDDLFYSRTFDTLILQAPIVFKRTMKVVRSHHQLHHGLFLVDSSLYRTKGEFESQINFVKSIAKRLHVSPTGTRAGVILYGNEPKLSVGLNDYSTLPELYTLLDNLVHDMGGRQLHKALILARETLQKSPQEIPKFVAVILEGQQYSSGSLSLLSDAVRPLQALGVTVYVVGIGQRLNRQELHTMVQTSRYIIQVPRFTELLRQMELIAYRIETTLTDPCHETLDVGFVIDASGSVGMDRFSREKNFVRLVSRRFAATSPNTRLGLLVFSDTPKLSVDFADYESKTIEQFQANVAEVEFQDGRSRIDLALRAASQDFFTNRRSGVPRVLILVSDGRQSEDPGYYPLATAVKPLQAQRVRIVGVGFGDGVDVENLKEITGTKDRILLDKEIDDIDRLQMELVSKACEA